MDDTKKTKAQLIAELDALRKVSNNNAIKKKIIERRQTGAERRQESRMHINLLDNLPCVALILKKETREIVASNKAAREIGAVLGKTCYETCAQRDDICPFCRAPELWESNEPKRLEVEYNGTWLEEIWVPLSDDLYVHYIFNITTRKQAEETIINLSKFPSENPHPVLRINADGKILYNNEAVDRLLNEANLSRKQIYEVLPKNLKTLIILALKTGEIVPNLEVRVGSKIFSYWLTPIRESQYVNLYGRDLTEKREIEKSLKLSNKNLEKRKIELEHKTIALREVIREIEDEKHKIKNDITINVREVLLPIIGKMMLTETSNDYLNLLKHHLENIISSFGRNISANSVNLTPREIQICTMIESGLTNKEISKLLGISCHTVETHRNSIREKFNITNNNINLCSFLQQL